MELYARIEQILLELRPAFSRDIPFEWFVLLMWGLLLTTCCGFCLSLTRNFER